MVNQFLYWFAEREIAFVGKEFAPEADVKEVGDGMVGTDVDIGRSPVFYCFRIPSVVFVFRASVAPEIPT